MDFFKHCRSEEEKKELYRTLAKCFHPDKNGTDYLMCELNKQYINPIQRESFHQRFMGNHIPFDNPIHEEIIIERNRVEHLMDELRKKEDYISFLSKHRNLLLDENRKVVFENADLMLKIRCLEIEKEDLNKTILERDEKDIKSKKKIERMEFVMLFLSIILILTNI